MTEWHSVSLDTIDCRDGAKPLAKPQSTSKSANDDAVFMVLNVIRVEVVKFLTTGKVYLYNRIMTHRLGCLAGNGPPV